MSIRKKAMKRIITFVLLLAMAATLVNPLAEINVKASGIGGTELQKDETGLEDTINKTGSNPEGLDLENPTDENESDPADPDLENPTNENESSPTEDIDKIGRAHV